MLTLLMLTVAAFTGLFMAEVEEVLNGASGCGLLFWPLLMTAIPISYEFLFLFAKDGMFRKFDGCFEALADHLVKPFCQDQRSSCSTPSC